MGEACVGFDGAPEVGVGLGPRGFPEKLMRSVWTEICHIVWSLGQTWKDCCAHEGQLSLCSRSEKT